MSIFMKIDGIKGDVTAELYKGWIKLNTFNIDNKKPVSNKPGALHHRSVSLPRISNVRASKQADRASPLLFTNSCQSTTLGTIVIQVCRTDTKLREYLEYRLYDAIISYYEMGIFEDEHQSAENFEALGISYTKLEMKYTPRDSQNQAMSPVTAGYDLASAQIL